MKILAISRYLRDVDWTLLSETLKQEALQAYKAYLDGIIREIYFTENHDAVIIMECQTLSEAGDFLAKLPLVEEKIIEFQISELKPYTGFSRLMDSEKYNL